MAWPDIKVIRFRSREATAPKNTATEQHREVGVLFCPNVGRTERIVTGIAGAVLVAYGLLKEKKSALVALAGTGLLLRAGTGFCPVYAATGIGRDRNWPPSTATETKRALSGPGGIHIRAVVTIDRPVNDVYSFWHDFENLPRFMENLEAVRVFDSKRSHWVARGPAGTTAEWDAEIIHEEAGKVIGWQSLPGSQIVNAGSVNFDQAPDGRGTVVTVSMQYEPPAGKLGAAVSAVMGEAPGQQIQDDLSRLKQLLERSA